MIVLDVTTKSLQLKLAAAVTTNQLPFTASYFDSTGSGTTLGEEDGTSNGNTAVTAVSSPAASTQRSVKHISIQNADTAAATVTVIYNNNSTLRTLVMVTLAVGDQLVYEDGAGWKTLDKNGNIKMVQGGSFGPYATATLGQLPGTTTNDNASAGNIGEYVSASVASGSAVSLTSGTSTNVTSISLSAGDWDVSGLAGFNLSSTATQQIAGINSTSATLPSVTAGGGLNVLNVSSGIGQGSALPLSPVRFSLSTTTTIYLVAFATFASGTATADGSIRARRVR